MFSLASEEQLKYPEEIKELSSLYLNGVAPQTYTPQKTQSMVIV